ncbi:MAG TPA: hypothetical protein VFG15_23650 [Amycolatopsis sp.]|nr:hypothetical protein [Amycolatopsis sp.]
MTNSAGKHRKRATIGIASVFGVAAIAPDGPATESCQGLDTALRGSLEFLAGQQADPDAVSAARIANRQAVVDLIQQRSPGGHRTESDETWTTTSPRPSRSPAFPAVARC